MFAAFDRGELVIDESTHEVRFTLSFRHLATLAAIMVTCMGAWAWSENFPAVPFIVVIMWLWLTGGNVLFAVPLFKNFLRTAVDSAPIQQ